MAAKATTMSAKTVGTPAVITVSIRNVVNALPSTPKSPPPTERDRAEEEEEENAVGTAAAPLRRSLPGVLPVSAAVRAGTNAAGEPDRRIAGRPPGRIGAGAKAARAGLDVAVTARIRAAPDESFIIFDWTRGESLYVRELARGAMGRGESLSPAIRGPWSVVRRK